MAIQQFFPYVPQYISWENWNGALIQFFSEEPIPYNPETNWRETAKAACELPTFAAYPVSDPDRFKNWQDWALDFTEIINGPSS